MERLKLEEIGLKHIDTFNKLEKLCLGFHKFLLSKNPFESRKKKGYDAYRYQIRMYILALFGRSSKSLIPLVDVFQPGNVL